jgi:hypothetical protein
MEASVVDAVVRGDAGAELLSRAAALNWDTTAPATVIVLVAVTAFVVVRFAAVRRIARHVPSSEPPRGTPTPTRDADVTGAAGKGTDTRDVPSDTIICCSGAGESAAFSLGGLQRASREGLYENARAVVGVSGAGYMAGRSPSNGSGRCYRAAHPRRDGR